MSALSMPRLVAVFTAAVCLAACGPQEGSNASNASNASKTSNGNNGRLPVKTSTSPLPARATAPAADSTRPGAGPAAALPGEAGVVTAVVPLRTTQPPSGAGALIGGVVGAAVGHQIGGGSGRKAATVVGAVGGAVAGHHIEKDRNTRNTRITGYRIELQLDTGRKASVTQSQPGALAAGQRVRLVDGSVVPA